MEPMNLTKNNFPIYQSSLLSETNLNSVSYPSKDYTIMKSRIFSETLIFSETKAISSIRIEEYTILKDRFKKYVFIGENPEEKLFLFNSAFIECSYDKEILSKAIRDIRSNPLNDDKDYFVMEYTRNLVAQQCKTNNFFEKFKFLVNSGEKVNNIAFLDDKNKFTPLNLILNFDLDDKYLKELINAGGIVYEQITKEQQDRVNKIIQQISDEMNEKIILMHSLFADKQSDFSVLPNELKSIIGLNALNNLAPEVPLKIFRMNRINESKTSKINSEPSSVDIEKVPTCLTSYCKDSLNSKKSGGKP